ncbi:MAG TPA: hypothetical protein VIF36_00885 [Gaiellaceae bacterium]
MVDADWQILEHLEPYLREASPDAAAAMLALVAFERVDFDADELAGSVRRALLVLASGGDLRRELSLEDRAVTGLAADLDDPERRTELEAALRELRAGAEELPASSSALDALLEDPERAWRALAAAVLADELTDDDPS